MSNEMSFDDAMDSLCQIMLNEWSKEEIIEYIRSRDENYEDRMESHYTFSERWKTDKAHRPWRHSIEIDEELRERENK